jgi:hypothetical protein
MHDRIRTREHEKHMPRSRTLAEGTHSSAGYDTLTTSKVAAAKGLLECDGDQRKLTDAGKAAGGEFRCSKRYGPYFLWPKDMTI